MNDEERRAQLNLIDWQIDELELELVRVDESGEDAGHLLQKVADLKARVEEWRRS